MECQKFLCEWFDGERGCFAARLCRPATLNINAVLIRYKGDRNGAGNNQHTQGYQQGVEHDQGKVRLKNKKRSDRPNGGGISRQPSRAAAEAGVCEEGAEDSAGERDSLRNSGEPPTNDRSERYEGIIQPTLKKKMEKLSGKYPKQCSSIYRKIQEILQNPQHYKNLRAPLQHLKRVRISGSFVLTFSVNENTKKVTFEDFDHHDRIYWN